MKIRTTNIQHPTSNIQMRDRRTIGCWLLLTMFFLAALPLRAEEPAAAPVTRTLDQAELTLLLTQTLQQDYVKDRGELELRITQPWTARKISSEPLTVKTIEIPTIGVTSSFIVKFELRNASNTIATLQLPVQAHVWRQAWVAHSMLKRGDSLADADIARERRDVLVVHEPFADFDSATSTLEIAEPVGVGAPLFARSVRLTPVVHRGQLVQALLEDGALSIVMKVEVLEDGAPGQIIRARNKQTLRDIRGKVLNDHTILVSL